ncbi:hypothetical protein AAMO2058_000004100 [Amorphochlora amoebiformis]
MGKRKQDVLVSGLGRRWSEMYEGIVSVDSGSESNGLKLQKTQLRTARPSRMHIPEDGVVFNPRPLLEPLALVECTDCHRRVKIDAFASHSELCKHIRSEQTKSASPDPLPRQDHPYVGIPKGLRFAKGPGTLSIRALKNNTTYYNRWRGQRIHQLGRVASRSSPLPSVADPLAYQYPEEKPPLARLFPVVKKATETRKEVSNPKKRPSKPSTSKSSQKDKKSNSRAKEAKEKRPKKPKAPKSDSKRSSTKKRAPKKNSKLRKGSKSTTSSEIQMPNPPLPELGPPSPLTLSLGPGGASPSIRFIPNAFGHGTKKQGLSH